nr:hypothetical protein [Falsiroseomonas tokyonensis]
MRPGARAQAKAAAGRSRLAGNAQRGAGRRAFGAQRAFHHQIAGGRQRADQFEAHPAIQRQRAVIARHHDQPDAAAAGHRGHACHDARQDAAAEPAALVRSGQDEPAQPPAAGIPGIGVDDMEADHSALGLNSRQGMGGAAADAGGDLGKRPEKVLDLVGIQIHAMDDVQFSPGYRSVVKGLPGPRGKHDVLLWLLTQAPDAHFFCWATPVVLIRSYWPR